VSLSPATQELFEQHPVQLVGPQVVEPHEPPEQVWPGAHAGPVPHRHSPLAEQPSARVGLQTEQVAPPVPQRCAEGA